MKKDFFTLDTLAGFFLAMALTAAGADDFASAAVFVTGSVVCLLLDRERWNSAPSVERGRAEPTAEELLAPLRKASRELGEAIDEYKKSLGRVRHATGKADEKKEPAPSEPKDEIAALQEIADRVQQRYARAGVAVDVELHFLGSGVRAPVIPPKESPIEIISRAC